MHWESDVNTERADFVKALRSMDGLMELEFKENTIDAAAADAFIDMLQECQQEGGILLPDLHRLEFKEAFEQLPDMRRVFGALSPKIAFPSVTQLKFDLKVGDDALIVIQSLTSALAKGSFSRLEFLSFERSNLTVECMVALLEGLYAFECGTKGQDGGGGVGSACRETRLSELSLRDCEMSAGGIKAIANVIEKGGLASLRVLDLFCKPSIGGSATEIRAFIFRRAGVQRTGCE